MAEIAALVIVQVLFGINYVISKQVIASFHPLVWAGLRAAIATVLLFGFARVSGRPRPRLDRDFLLPILGFAMLGTVINQTCFLVGLKYTTSTNSAVINTLIPIATLLFSVLLRREQATPSPDPQVRLDHARISLHDGRIEDAIADLQRLPGGPDAQNWITAARRYAEGQSALDMIEATALLEPRNLHNGAGEKIGQAGPTVPAVVEAASGSK